MNPAAGAEDQATREPFLICLANKKVKTNVLWCFPDDLLETLLEKVPYDATVLMTLLSEVNFLSEFAHKRKKILIFSSH